MKYLMVMLDEIDDSLDRVSKLLAGIPDGVYRAVGSALKRSAQHGLTVGTKIVTEKYAISQGELKARTRNINTIVKDTAGSYEVTFGYYERVEQYKVSDIKFLSQLCHDAGISLKATNNILVLFDQADYEAKDPTFTVKRGSGSYTKYDLSVGTADTKYTSCRVRYADPATGRVIEGTAYAEDYKADSKNNQQLEVTAKVASIAEAQTLAAKQLRLHNKYSRTATFTFPGDPSKVAGVTATLEGWGAWDGKYIIKQSKHSLGSSGYTTQTVLRRILEGY